MYKFSRALNTAITCLVLLCATNRTTASGVSLVKDLNTVGNSSDVQDIVSNGTTAFFFGRNATSGVELWVTDGTEAGTSLISDINPGTGNAARPDPNFNRIVMLNNGTVLFAATNGNAALNFELYKSDGTAAGTVLVKDIYPGTTGSFPGDVYNSSTNKMVAAGNRAFFVATDNVNGRQLWVSDGTEAGTNLVKVITPGGTNNITNMIPVGNNLFFIHPAYNAVTDTTAAELWFSDGTEAGTNVVAYLSESATSTLTPKPVAAFNGKLYFTMYDSPHGRELWSSDGTQAGTGLLADIYPGTDSAFSYNDSLAVFKSAGGYLYFRATDGVHGRELWRTDGTAVGTVMVEDINPGSANSDPYGFITVGSEVWFGANDGTTGVELWRTQGAAGTTSLVADAAPDLDSSNPGEFTVADGKLFYYASVGGIGLEPWVSDGTPEGTHLIIDLLDTSEYTSAPNTHSSMLNSTFMTTVNDRPIWRARSMRWGWEIYTSDGTAEGTHPVKDLVPGTMSGGIQNLISVGNRLYFTYYMAASGLNNGGWQLGSSDGTAVGTTWHSFLNNLGIEPQYLVGYNGECYFSAGHAGLDGRELWKSDGTDAGTVMAFDLYTGPAGFPKNDGYPYYSDSLYSNGTPVVFDNMLYFRGANAAAGLELFKTNGTLAGTSLVKDVRPGTGHSYVQELTVMGNTIYFSAMDTSTNRELWKSDGTEAGTMMVKDVVPVGVTSNLAYLTPMNGILYFRTQELWRSDGTNDGTYMVKDIRLSGASTPDYLKAIGNTLYFSATDNTNNRELWKSDGTEEGTLMVKDINPGNFSSNPGQVCLAGGTIFFAATNPASGTELWKTDGTDAGTVLVKDIRPDSASSSPTNLMEFAGRLVFLADNGVHGQELWASDGTADGTFLVADIAPGSASSNITSMVVHSDGKLYINPSNNADLPGDVGNELWVVEPTAVPVSVSHFAIE